MVLILRLQHFFSKKKVFDELDEDGNGTLELDDNKLHPATQTGRVPTIVMLLRRLTVRQGSEMA